MEDLIERWRGVYDRIVIDTPPVLGLSETAVVQRVADGVVLVVRAEVTPQKDIVDAVDLLARSGAHMYGFVLNGIDLSKSANYYQYQYYSADYYSDLEELAGGGGDVAASDGPPSRRETRDSDPETLAPDDVLPEVIRRRPRQNTLRNRPAGTREETISEL